MKFALRIGVLALFLLAMPSAASADTSSLVWGDIVMLEGGTYSVPLNVEAPAYVTGPSLMPDGEFVFRLSGNLYKVTDAGREFVQALHEHDRFDDPDDPDDGDPLLAWPAAGSYELDLLGFPPPIVNFEDRFRRFLAHIFFADVAHAQFGDPTLLETIHFTIEEVQTEPDPVIIIPGILGSDQHNGVWIIDPILHTYDDLIATLDANGYTPEQDLFTFPYNWRKSNVETAVLLKQKINEVKRICGCDKVDLVAHSMGGLVARQYIQSDAYGNDVDQLIFLGTPHLGAPKAYLMWEGGEVGPRFSVWDSALEIILSHEAHEHGFSHLFDYLRTTLVESVRELLPIYDYIFDGSQLRDYPSNYPTNSFLENLEDGIDKLLSSGVELHNIVGETLIQQTIVGIDATNPTAYLPKWLHGYPRDFYELLGAHGLIRGQGDETVPFNSAARVATNLKVTASAHNAIPEDSMPEIFKILTGNDASTLIDNINLPNLNIVIVKMLSPANLLVIAPDGKKIGKDFNGQEINEIPNAFYTGFNTDTEFITILNPLDGEYGIYAQGTGSGPYTVETSFITSTTTNDASFTGNTGPGITTQLNLEVKDGAIPPGALDIVVTYESTLADIERIYALGWMKKWVYKDVRGDFKHAFKKKKGKRVVDKDDLEDILEDLEDYRGKGIKEQGYQILKADIEWLINH